MDSKEKDQSKQEAKPADNSFMKIGLIAGGVVGVAVIGVLLAIIVPRLSAGKAEKAPEAATNELDRIAVISLGRVEVSKANDPMQQSYTRVSVLIDLVVPADRSGDVGAEITRLASIFKESARQAFLDADSRDLATENVGGVKNAIKTRINEKLGQEVVKEVVFPEYKAF
jgi:flagellar basal body-associated protein FliL